MYVFSFLITNYSNFKEKINVFLHMFLIATYFLKIGQGCDRAHSKKGGAIFLATGRCPGLVYCALSGLKNAPFF